MFKRLTIEYVKDKFNKEHYTLLSKKYTNSRTHLHYICPKGHRHSTNWDNWKQLHRCPICAGQGKPSIKDIRSSFEREGYKLLSNKYINAPTKLNYTCSEGHKHNITWNNWLNGKRCPYCACRPPININKVSESFKSEKYKLLSKEYINCEKHLYYICNEGHRHFMGWNSWNKGHRCPTCYRLSNFGSGNPGWKGGISFDPYCEAWKDKEYKKDIKERDGNKCLNPYCSYKNSTDLTIHHIDYDKKSCAPFNLITLCRSCNSKANKDRNWHKAWYQAILNKRFNYIY